MPTLQKLIDQETREMGYTHRISVTHEDLTETTANTSQTIAIYSAAAGLAVTGVGYAYLVTPFQDASDAALNTTTIIVGDGGNDDRYLASMQVNANGTPVTYKLGPYDTCNFVYTTADTIDIIFGSMTAKSLSNIDTGQVDIYLHLAPVPDISLNIAL
jgi:hypothetical protein